MAEIQTTNRNSRRRTAAPRVDLTPMVDLGFLLITFFMLTTILYDPHVMTVYMPVPPLEAPVVQTSFIDTSTITLMPVSKHRVAYYHGEFSADKPVHIIPMQELRAVITQKQSALKLLPDSYSDNARKIQVLIKPSPSSQYQDLVNTLDEMLINNVRTYAIVDISPQEQEAVEKVM